MVESRAWVTIAVLVSQHALASSPAAAGEPRGVATVVGSCPGALQRLQSSAAWNPVRASQPLLAGTILKTGAHGATVALADGTRLELHAHSSVQVQAATEVNLDPRATTRVSRADLKSGAFEVAVPQGAKPLLSILGKNTMMAFEPGRGSLQRTEPGAVAIVEQGTARAASAGRLFNMPAGHYIVLRTSGRQDKPKPLPPSPRFAQEPCHATAFAPCAIAVAVGPALARVGARWNPASAGLHYWVVLTRGSADGERLAETQVAGDQPTFVSGPLMPGAYWMSVRTVNAEGMQSPPALRPLRVVRLLPDSGSSWLSSQQTLVVPPGRSVRVDGAQGVRLSYDGQTYGPAPATLVVGAQHRHALAFKLEGDATDDAGLMLEPSLLRADVQLTPSTARWPQDRVHLKVHLRDPAGRVDASTMHPRLRVTIDQAAVQVGVYYAQGAWQADIPPRSGRGPWAIRVEALDADDNVLGRGLLQVLGTEAPRSW